MTADLREKVTRAIISEALYCVEPDTRISGLTNDELLQIADAAIAIVLEEAAQFVQDECHDYDDSHRIATAIRALKGKP